MVSLGDLPYRQWPRRNEEDADLFGHQLDADLNWFGTNQGLIMRRRTSIASSSAGSEDDDSDSDSEPANDYELRLGGTAAAPLPQHVQAHIDDQADQIVQLECDNEKLSYENINLKEVLSRMPAGSGWSFVQLTLRV